MLLGGLWHGANWTFLLWGAWHGGLLAIERALGIGGSARRFRVGHWAMTFLFVMLGWVTFRASGIGEAFGFYHAMFSFDGLGLSAAYTQDIRGLNLAILVLAYAVVLLMGLRDRLQWSFDSAIGARLRAALPVVLVPVFLLTVLKLSAENFSPFLYFQF